MPSWVLNLRQRSPVDVFFNQYGLLDFIRNGLDCFHDLAVSLNINAEGLLTEKMLARIDDIDIDLLVQILPALMISI